MLVAVMSGTYIKGLRCFGIMILELCRRGKVTISNNEIIISKDYSDIQFYEAKMLQLIERTFSHNNYGTTDGYPLLAMEKILKKKRKSRAFQNEMGQIYLEFMNVHMAFRRNPQYKQPMDYLYRYFRNTYCNGILRINVI